MDAGEFRKKIANKVFREISSRDTVWKFIPPNTLMISGKGRVHYKFIDKHINGRQHIFLQSDFENEDLLITVMDAARQPFLFTVSKPSAKRNIGTYEEQES